MCYKSVDILTCLIKIIWKHTIKIYFIINKETWNKIKTWKFNKYMKQENHFQKLKKDEIKKK